MGQRRPYRAGSSFLPSELVAAFRRHCERFADCLVRLPLFHELTEPELDRICDCIGAFHASSGSGANTP